MLQTLPTAKAPSMSPQNINDRAAAGALHLACARREFLTRAGSGAATLGFMAITGGTVFTAAAKTSPEVSDDANFYHSAKVKLQKVSFKSQYQMTIRGNLFVPKNFDRSKAHPALVVSHPMGAVKEQSANLYATRMAEQGFITLSIDLPCWGESEGPRNLVSPEMYAEAFSAAVDFLGTQRFIDRKRIGAIGICGSGSFLISAAKIDPRIAAIATISMYDMGAVNRQALKNSMTLEQRKTILAEAAEQRYREFQGGEIALTGGTDLQLTANTHPIQREFFDFYRTARGQFTPPGASAQNTTKPTLASNVKFMNFFPFNDLESISPRPLLFISGDQAHSKEFSEDAYQRAAEPKEIFWVAGAGHVDLYDRMHLIPWDKLTSFFNTHLVALAT